MKRGSSMGVPPTSLARRALPGRASLLLAATFASGALSVACGPTQIELDPRTVVDVQVRPASGQRLFCPGDNFQVELVAKLLDGSSCSSTDRSRGCLGEKDAVIKAQDVRIQVPGAGRVGDAEQFIWSPPADPLVTADTGLLLRGWIEKAIAGQTHKSMVGETELKPVYECQLSRSFAPTYIGSPGSNGGQGPDVTIAITTLSTPWYPSAALVRVEAMGSKHYFISPTVEQAVKITTFGQPGAPGAPGHPGKDGQDGDDAPDSAPACTKGGIGQDGGDGGPGGDGGDGGQGGLIRVMLDDRAADKLRGRVLPQSLGGIAGGPGPGGLGGNGGQGGKGAKTTTACSDNDGKDGRRGSDGRPGRPGRPGQNGPAPVETLASRDSLFAAEMPAIKRIEAAKGKGQ